MIINLFCPDCAQPFASTVVLEESGDGAYDVVLDSCDCGWYPSGAQVAEIITTHLTHEEELE